MATEAVRSTAPPQQSSSAFQWARKNLFDGLINSLISIVVIGFFAWLIVTVIQWALTTAGWQAVLSNQRLLWAGRYPADLIWRLELGVWVVALLLGLSAGVWRGVLVSLALGFAGLMALLAPLSLLLPPPAAVTGNPLPPVAFLLGAAALTAAGYAIGLRAPARFRWLLTLLWVLSFPFIMLGLVRGFGEEAGTGAWRVVPTNLWGGFLVTIALTVVGIVASFPLGILLALGRRSKLPVVKLFCTVYIEVVRGVPLVTVFFIAQLLLPLFLPQGVSPDNLLRAMVAVTLFSAAYLAENVRGGLQSLPKGQTEAAQALGLNYWQTTLFITLPQALRAVIPALVGQFISLFKDTSLVIIVGLFDLLGMAQVVTKQPEWLGIPGGVWKETLFFVALIYFIVSFTMSRVSLNIERKLGVGRRR